jgi:hypothetical protein
MSCNRCSSAVRRSLLAGSLCAGLAVSAALAQSPPPAPEAAAPASAPAALRYQPNRFSHRATLYYEQVWGVDALSVKAVESGEIIRFAWRVLDPEKAKMIHDKQFEPSLIDLQAGVSLVVPAVEQVGQLRQAGTPEAGRAYWMAFSNKGRHVKRGDRVDVVIGRFRANGLVVE